MSPQTEFGVGGVVTSAAICFPLHRSLFTVMYFTLRLNIRCRFRLRQGVQCPPEVNDPYQYKCGGVKAYKKGKGLASGCCPPLNFVCGNESVTHSAQSKFSWVFCLEYLSRHSEKVDGHFANCRFSFRDLLIFISFRKLQ